MGWRYSFWDGSLPATLTLAAPETRGPAAIGDHVATQQAVLRGQTSGAEPLLPRGTSPISLLPPPLPLRLRG